MNDRLEKLFESKNLSTREFRAVQERQGMLATPDIPVNQHTREGTIELHKGLHWINLELFEYIEAGADTMLEELSDVLHFLLEFSLLANLSDDDIVPTEQFGLEGDRLDYILNASKDDSFVFQDGHTNARFTMLAVLRVADILKNKPWKQTLRDGSWEEVRDRTRGIWYWFGATVRTAGFESEEIFNEFMRKSEINHNRITGGV